MSPNGQVVVAAGEDFSDNVNRALFLTSTDGGAHFSRVNPGPTGSTNEGASHIASGRMGFLASGVSADVPQLWSSADGHQWRRITVPSGVFNSEDTIDAITETVQGGC